MILDRESVADLNNPPDYADLRDTALAAMDERDLSHAACAAVRSERDALKAECARKDAALRELVAALDSERYGIEVGDAAQRMAVTNHADRMLEAARAALTAPAGEGV